MSDIQGRIVGDDKSPIVAGREHRGSYPHSPWAMFPGNLIFQSITAICCLPSPAHHIVCSSQRLRFIDLFPYLKEAVFIAIADGAKPSDLGGILSTTEFTEEVAQRIKNS